MNNKYLTIFKKGFNYSQDGPGNRLVYHLAGCNMRCPWCSNPEGMNILNLENSEYLRMTLDEVYQDILSCKRLFFDGGGVCFTGGEASLQLDALKILFEKLNASEIDVTIETNGTNPRLKELFPFMKYLIIDYKHYDEEEHLKITGLSNKMVEKNIEVALEFGLKVLVRIPLVNGYNANISDISGFINYFKKINHENLSVEFLKYHEYGKDKWQKLNLQYRVLDGFVEDSIYNQFQLVFRENKIKVITT